MSGAWTGVSDVAAAVAAAAALATVLDTVKFGKHTATKLGEAAVAQVRAAQLLNEVVESMRQEAERSSERIRPKVAAIPVGIPSGARWKLMLRNSGGPAQPAVFGALKDGALYGASLDVPSPCPPDGQAGLQQITDHVFRNHPDGVVLLLARDVHGQWWDMLTGVRWTDPVPEPATREFLDWKSRTTVYAVDPVTTHTPLPE
jgi:hypothetical protein